MAKAKAEGVKKVVHPHIHARLAFLQRAAQILEEQQDSSLVDRGSSQQVATNTHKACSRPFEPKSNALARELSSHTTSIVRKTKIRIAPQLKQTICKGCSSKLIDGQSSSTSLENKSRDGTKAWANVKVVTCLSCGMEKRFPEGQTRGLKKAQRPTQKLDTSAGSMRVEKATDGV